MQNDANIIVVTAHFFYVKGINAIRVKLKKKMPMESHELSTYVCKTRCIFLFSSEHFFTK